LTITRHEARAAKYLKKTQSSSSDVINPTMCNHHHHHRGTIVWGLVALVRRTGAFAELSPRVLGERASTARTLMSCILVASPSPTRQLANPKFPSYSKGQPQIVYPSFIRWRVINRMVMVLMKSPAPVTV